MIRFKVAASDGRVNYQYDSSDYTYSATFTSFYDKLAILYRSNKKLSWTFITTQHYVKNKGWVSSLNLTDYENEALTLDEIKAVIMLDEL